MRSGNSHPNHFAGNGFSQRMFRRVFEFDVTGAVEKARKQAYIDYADMKSGMDVPQEIVDDTDAYIDITTKSHAERPKIVRAAVDAVFGVPKKEKKHDGLVVANSSPPTSWPADTFGARAFGFYDQVKENEGNDRADADKAVQLATQDMDARELVRARAAEQMLAFYKERYNQILTGRNVVDAQAQGQVNALLADFPSQACRDTIASEWETCSAATEGFAADNASAISNFDSPQGRSARSEYAARGKACLEQAKKTRRGASTAVIGDQPVPTQIPNIRCGPGRTQDCKGRLPDRVPAARYDADRSHDGRGAAPAYEVSHAGARVQQEAVGGRLRIREVLVPATEVGRTSEDREDDIERRHDDLPADAVIGESPGETTPADDLPGCTSSRSRGQWICEDSEAHDRCLVAVQRGAARGCALQVP